MPAPRLSSSAVDRPNTSTAQPRSPRTSAAVIPPSEPPTTPTRGQLLTSGGQGWPKTATLSTRHSNSTRRSSMDGHGGLDPLGDVENLGHLEGHRTLPFLWGSAGMSEL
jgi:hypothetical protein